MNAESSLDDLDSTATEILVFGALVCIYKFILGAMHRNSDLVTFLSILYIKRGLANSSNLFRTL